jgi:hypothetical protein
MRPVLTPRTVRITRYVTPLREGGSLPAIVEPDDGGLYVLKFRGAGQGALALIAELVSGELARALGLSVPELVFAELDLISPDRAGPGDSRADSRQRRPQPGTRLPARLYHLRSRPPANACRSGLADRLTIVQMSPVHTGRTTDPGASLGRLMDRVVRRRPLPRT